jgi:hypothetical protein
MFFSPPHLLLSHELCRSLLIITDVLEHHYHMESSHQHKVMRPYMASLS